MKIPISKRLLCCVGLVPPGGRVADVGCDHGYLGIYLLREGLADFVMAMDLRHEPLQRAKVNAARFGTASRMRFYVCDGLQALEQGSVDTVVCAGLGGDAIAKILDDCPWAMICGAIWENTHSPSAGRFWFKTEDFYMRPWRSKAAEAALCRPESNTCLPLC